MLILPTTNTSRASPSRYDDMTCTKWIMKQNGRYFCIALALPYFSLEAVYGLNEVVGTNSISNMNMNCHL